MSHWSSGLTLCFPSQGTWVQNPWGDLCETGILLLAVSRYIGDPDVIDHHGLVWGGLRPKPSLGPRANNVIIPLDLTQLSCPSFTLAAGLPSGFTTDGVGCLGESPVESLQSHFILTMSHWSSGLTLCFLSQGTWVQNPWGDLCETGILLLALSCYMIIVGHPFRAQPIGWDIKICVLWGGKSKAADDTRNSCGLIVKGRRSGPRALPESRIKGEEGPVELRSPCKRCATNWTRQGDPEQKGPNRMNQSLMSALPVPLTILRHYNRIFI